MELIYAAPSKFKVSPFGTCIGQVLDSEGEEVKVRVWIQVSQDMANIEWLPEDKFLALAFGPRLPTDQSFREQALASYIKNTKG